MTDRCNAPTNYSGDKRTCELPAGHAGRCQYTTVTPHGTGILYWQRDRDHGHVSIEYRTPPNVEHVDITIVKRTEHP